MADAQIDGKGVVTTCPSCGQRNRIGMSRMAAPTRCGKCHAAIAPPGEPIETPDAASFDAAVTQSDLPVVVDFGRRGAVPAAWWRPSWRGRRQHAGKFHSEGEHGCHPELGDRFQIRSIRRWRWSRRAGIRRTAGARPAAEIEACIESTLR